MSAPIPAVEPSIITAGDSVSWTKSLPDYSGWTLNYAAQGASQINFVATGSGSFAVNLLTSDTTGWMPGAYELVGYVTHPSTNERVTVFRGPLSILADPASQPPSSHAQYALYLIELAIEGRIPRGLENYVIDGQSIAKITITQLVALRDKYKAEVRAEQDQAAVAAGLASPRTIFARFRNPVANRWPFMR